METPRILVVDDEKTITDLVGIYLRNEGYDVTLAYTGADAARLILEQEFDLAVLDIMLPDEDGISILKRLKGNDATAEIPVIMLSAKSSEIDKVTGLENGADDYITKPFGIMELLSRIKAVLRRSHTVQKAESHVLSAHDLTIDLDQRTVVYLETEIVLTYKEFELLSYLVRNRGTAISRDRLLEQVWGFSYEGETRTVDAHVKTLRQKLDAAGCSNLIHTVRGYGYKIGG